MKTKTLFTLIALFVALSSFAQTAIIDSSKQVTIYYFHYTQRCHTCIELEATAKLSVESLYAEQVTNGEYSFKGINIDEPEGKILQKKYDIAGQTLLVVRGEKKVDITDQGFSNAQNLEGMKTAIKNAVDTVRIK